MSHIVRNFRLVDDAGNLGLSCTPTGVALAGAPLLRTTAVGWAARPATEIAVLIDGAYGPAIDPTDVTRGLDVIARALNCGDLGRALVAAVQLKLPELTWDGAVRIARAHDALAKQYNPDEPRDWHGRWTTDGGANADDPRTDSGPSQDGPGHLYGGRLIPVAGGPSGGIGGNMPPPEAEMLPEAEADFNAPRVPQGWDTPAQIIDGVLYPPSRNPTLPDGTPWPVADVDSVRSALAPQPRTTPTMNVYVPLDGVGPVLVGSTADFEYIQPDGYDVVVLKGTPQVTNSRGVRTDHDLKGIEEALRLAATNQFSQISFNQSFTRSTNGLVRSKIRPDVFAVVRPPLNLPYRYYPWETLSPRQTLPRRQAQMPLDPSVAPVDGRSYKRLWRLSAERLAELGVTYVCS